MTSRFLPRWVSAGALSMTLACSATAQTAAPATPSDADMAASLRARGMYTRPICFLTAIDFPFKPTGLGLAASEVQVAENLSKLGLLIMRQDPGGLSVRFDLTDAGKAAFISDGSGVERGFCAGQLVVQDIRRGSPGVDTAGRPNWAVTFTTKLVPNARAAWAKHPDAARLLPDLQGLAAGQQKQLKVLIAQVRGGWQTVSDITPAP